MQELLGRSTPSLQGNVAEPGISNADVNDDIEGVHPSEELSYAAITSLLGEATSAETSPHVGTAAGSDSDRAAGIKQKAKIQPPQPSARDGPLFVGSEAKAAHSNEQHQAKAASSKANQGKSIDSLQPQEASPDVLDLGLPNVPTAPLVPPGSSQRTEKPAGDAKLSKQLQALLGEAEGPSSGTNGLGPKSEAGQQGCMCANLQSNSIRALPDGSPGHQ